MKRCWAILTGAYPPAPGGVSDYTRVVARALAEAGDEVHVFAPEPDVPFASDDGVRLHPMPGGFDLAGLAWLGDELDRLPPHREILVQYTPYAFGSGGVNLALPLWLRSRGRRDRMTVMFHEVMYPVRDGQPLRYNLLGSVHRLAAGTIARSAARLLVSTPRWATILHASCAADCRIDWTPVPSNLPVSVDRARALELRLRLAEPYQFLVGHFGTYGRWVAGMLEPVLRGLCERESRCQVLLTGRGSREFCAQMIDRDPALADRLTATGALDARATAEHLAACDALVQPYPDGITTRRGSAMAGLALGVALVTNAGELTEPIWAERGAVALAPSPAPIAIIETAAALSHDPDRRRSLSAASRALYHERFAVEHTVDVLRGHSGSAS